jgi:enoyl-[acyl-carrier protein] reductase II
MASYLQMGAAGAQLGTMFVCSEESIAHENFKKMFMRGNARDATVSVQVDKRFPVIPVRALKNAASEDFLDVQRDVINKYNSGELEMGAAQLEIEHYWAGALRSAVIDGDVERGSIMAGQSVGMVKKIEPVSEIIANLIEQAAEQIA